MPSEGNKCSLLGCVSIASENNGKSISAECRSHDDSVTSNTSYTDTEITASPESVKLSLYLEASVEGISTYCDDLGVPDPSFESRVDVKAPIEVPRAESGDDLVPHIQPPSEMRCADQEAPAEVPNGNDHSELEPPFVVQAVDLEAPVGSASSTVCDVGVMPEPPLEIQVDVDDENSSSLQQSDSVSSIEVEALIPDSDRETIESDEGLVPKPPLESHVDVDDENSSSLQRSDSESSFDVEALTPDRDITESGDGLVPEPPSTYGFRQDNETMHFDALPNQRIGTTITPAHNAVSVDPDTLDPSHPAMWAISFDQLMGLQERAYEKLGKKLFQQATMRDINREIIEPCCRETGKSYALHLNPQGLRVDAFITHAWDEPFAEFWESVQYVVGTSVLKPNLWICACALYQGDDIATQIWTESETLDDSPFVLALKHATEYVVVRNTKVDIYSRLWCVAELAYANKLGHFPNRTSVTGPDIFANSRSTCIDAEAFDPRDKERIVRTITNDHSIEEIDSLVTVFRTHASSSHVKRAGGGATMTKYHMRCVCIVAAVLIVVLLLILMPKE